MKHHTASKATSGKSGTPDSSFSAQVDAKATRKLKAQRSTTPGLWFGLGMMGLIGWSVVVPTLLGAILGIWLDKHGVGEHSWTLALLIGGLLLGCFNAWHWIDKEHRAIHKQQDNDSDNENQN